MSASDCVLRGGAIRAYGPTGVAAGPASVLI